jgi:hypothetical protein
MMKRWVVVMMPELEENVCGGFAVLERLHRAYTNGTPP